MDVSEILFLYISERPGQIKCLHLGSGGLEGYKFGTLKRVFQRQDATTEKALSKTTIIPI